jgi:hypothetical protein
MRLHSFLALSCVLSAAAFAADAPQIPKEPIAKKKELLFSDDLKGAKRNEKWKDVVPTFAIENGALKGTQTRDQNIPAADGKPEVKAHPAVFGLDVPTKDSVIECKIRFEGNTAMDVELDDREANGDRAQSHYGHLCRAQVKLAQQQVTILDERDGSQSNKLIELKKDPVANKDAINKIFATHTANFPAKLEANKWYTVVVEIAGDAMRVTLDGQPVAYFKSPGIGHPTKTRYEIGVSGKSGLFTDFKVWNAEPAK